MLINEYGDLDTLLARAGEIKQPKRREALLDNADKIRLSRDLVTLKKDTPVECSLDDFEVKAPDPAVVMEFLTLMEFRTLAGRVAAKLKLAAPVIEADKGYEVAGAHEEGAASTQVAFDPANYECIRDRAALARWMPPCRRR